MNIKIFTIPILGGEQLEVEMNRFLQQKIVVEIESQLVNGHSGTYWTFCVRYVDKSSKKAYLGGNQEKPNYKKILGEETFKHFLVLKQIRKEMAQEEAIPAFAICTDASLSEIAKLDKITIQTMQTVKGIGEKKATQYAEKFTIALQKRKIKNEKEG